MRDLRPTQSDVFWDWVEERHLGCLLVPTVVTELLPSLSYVRRKAIEGRTLHTLYGASGSVGMSVSQFRLISTVHLRKTYHHDGEVRSNN